MRTAFFDACACGLCAGAALDVSSRLCHSLLMPWLLHAGCGIAMADAGRWFQKRDGLVVGMRGVYEVLVFE